MKTTLSHSLEYQKRNFQVAIEDWCQDSGDEFILAVTHNGNQWSTIFLLPDEAREVIAKLQEYLETKDVAQD